MLLLTPTGALPGGPGWRPWVWFTVGVPAVLVAVMPVVPSGIGFRPEVNNPLDFSGFSASVRALNLVILSVTVAGVLVAAVELVRRFRRATGVERQQLRWVALAAGLTGASMLATVALSAADQVILVGWATSLGVVFLPVSVGAAVLRYRLYDLDRIISRAVAYGVLTVLLGGAYALMVLVLGQLLGRRSSLVTAFSARLREHVDLDTLTGELLAVAGQTVEPATASLWLRPRAGGR